VIETCRRLKISARNYLSAVLPGLANVRVQRLPALTPTTWAARTVANQSQHSSTLCLP
jgi:hypothetical protein